LHANRPVALAFFEQRGYLRQLRSPRNTLRKIRKGILAVLPPSSRLSEPQRDQIAVDAMLAWRVHIAFLNTRIPSGAKTRGLLRRGRRPKPADGRLAQRWEGFGWKVTASYVPVAPLTRATRLKRIKGMSQSVGGHFVVHVDNDGLGRHQRFEPIRTLEEVRILMAKAVDMIVKSLGAGRQGSLSGSGPGPGPVG